MVLSKNCFLLTILLALSCAGFAQDYDQHIEFPKEKKQENEKKKERPHQQQKDWKWNVIKIAPLALVMGQIPYAAELRLLYELAVAKNQSIFVGASFNFQNYLTQSIWDSINNQGYNFEDVLGWRVQGGYKYFPIKSNKAPKGLFIGPHVSYNTLTAHDRSFQDDKLKFVYFNVNLIGGYQIVAGRFVFEAVSGVGFKRNSIEYYTNGVKTDEQVIYSFKPTITINLGVAF